MTLTRNKDPRAHAAHDFLGLGLHGSFRPGGYPTVNVPVWPHCVLQVGIGHLTRRGKFYRNRISIGFMRYDYCCDRRIKKTSRHVR